VKWIKAPEALKVHMETLMQGVECEKKPMFGYPAYFINKNMFAGLFGDKVFLRLSADQVVLVSKSFPGLSHLEPMPGRPMKDYYEIPEKLHADDKRMARLIQEAADYCRSLAVKATKKAPTKAKKPKKQT
jgi:TfoX/Sxy family transcriptional regulator of competence genes